jgi:acyl-CoA carboxylase subunit beta
MEKMAQERKNTFIAQIEEESSAYYTSSRMIDDGVIDPRDTRNVIGFCLSVVYSEIVEGGNLYGVARM